MLSVYLSVHRFQVLYNSLPWDFKTPTGLILFVTCMHTSSFLRVWCQEATVVVKGLKAGRQAGRQAGWQADTQETLFLAHLNANLTIILSITRVQIALSPQFKDNNIHTVHVTYKYTVVADAWQ